MSEETNTDQGEQPLSYFDGIIGQGDALSALTFYVENQRNTGICPSLLISGRRGYGKSTIADRLGLALLRSDKRRHKKFIKVEGAACPKLKPFVESIIIPHIAENQETTLFLDEIHDAGVEVKNWLLAVLNPTQTYITSARYDSSEIVFDFRQFTFLAATTNAEKLSLPLQERLMRIDLKPYQRDELVTILHTKNPELEYTDNIEEEIVGVSRGSPRVVTQLVVGNITPYAQRHDKKIITPDDWHHICKIIGIKPMGLLSNEILILRLLNHRGPSTLTTLAACLGVDPTTVRRDYEPFLLFKNLIGIDGKRHLTNEGQKFLREHSYI